MTLESLFTLRQEKYLKNNLKYARYIMNDHFVLLLFLLFGVGGYAYTNYLDTISSGMVSPRIFLILFYFFSLIQNKVTLLLDPADQIYLLPKEFEFRKIFKKIVFTSFIKSSFIVALITFLSFPLYVSTISASIADATMIFLALISLKWLNLLVEIYPFFNQDIEKYKKIKQLTAFVTIFSLIGISFIHIKFISILILLLSLYTFYLFFTEKIYFNHIFKWETMIEAEEKRLKSIYRFMQLFIDVPHMDTQIKRLKILDPLVNWFSKHTKEPAYYYLSRIIFRNTEYSLLVVRITLIGSFLLLAIENFILSMIIIVLFLYMIGFQLIPLLNEVKQAPQFQIYPINEKEILISLSKIIRNILFVVSIILSIVTVYNLALTSFILLLVSVSFSYLFSYFYVPHRINKAN